MDTFKFYFYFITVFQENLEDNLSREALLILNMFMMPSFSVELPLIMSEYENHDEYSQQFEKINKSGDPGLS